MPRNRNKNSLQEFPDLVAIIVVVNSIVHKEVTDDLDVLARNACNERFVINSQEKPVCSLLIFHGMSNNRGRRDIDNCN